MMLLEGNNYEHPLDTMNIYLVIILTALIGEFARFVALRAI